MKRVCITLLLFAVLVSCSPPPQGPIPGSNLEVFVGVTLSEATEVDDKRMQWLPIADIRYWIDDTDLNHSNADLIAKFTQVHEIVVRSNDGKLEVLVWRNGSITLSGAPGPAAQGQVIDVATYHDTDRLCLALRVDSVAAASLHRLSEQRIGSPLLLVVDGEAVASETLSTAVGSSLGFCGLWDTTRLEQLKQSIVINSR
jgi:hypothetical protein